MLTTLKSTGPAVRAGSAAGAFLLTAVAATAVAATAVPPASAKTVDEVIARHVAARGGDRWQAIESMKLTGSYVAFSEDGPFTLIRKRGDKYHLDCQWNGHPVRIGYDGARGWMVNPMFGSESPQKMAGIDHQVLLQDVELATPFFTYRERGYEVELLDDGELDGRDMVRLRVARPDGFEETWYLDPETFLEAARESPGSDFGRPDRQITYFDDFREVAGVQVPHYVETQWYTRNRVLEVAAVEIGVEVDDQIFRMPLPPGMDRLAAMAGEWQVTVEERPQPGAPFSTSERTATLVSDLNGGLLRERLTTDGGYEVEITMLYDRFRERYVRSSINDFTYHLDVQVGNFDDGGRLTLSNVETGTSWSGFGMTFHLRTSVLDLSEDGFKVEEETSTDGGESWWLNARSTYTRKKE